MSAKLCCVSPENLPKTPPGFQAYVADFFRPQTILGQDCLIAFCTVFYNSIFNKFSKNPRKGIAPEFVRKDAKYLEGLPDGMYLDQWIVKESKKPADIRLLDQFEEHYSEETLDLD